MIPIQKIELPVPGIERLLAEAREEGYDFIETLVDEWASAENRFDAVESGKADLLCEPTSETLSRREHVGFGRAIGKSKLLNDRSHAGAFQGYVTGRSAISAWAVRPVRMTVAVRAERGVAELKTHDSFPVARRAIG